MLLIIGVLVYAGIFYAIVKIMWLMLQARDRSKRTIAFCQWVESQRQSQRQSRRNTQEVL